jgi:hypothetical protein
MQSKALPNAWVERLFDVMTATYGNRFLDMWRDTDIKKTKAHWAVELGEFRGETIAYAITFLRQFDWPPSLPEFIKLCEQARRERPAVCIVTQAQIEDNSSDCSPEETAAAKARAMETAKKCGFVKNLQTMAEQPA